VILVGGALNDRFTDTQLASLLAPEFAVFTYDRRGRGDSSDTGPYSVEREIDDLAALVERAGGSAQVYGTSSGANLALEAATRGLAIIRLALWEPNFLVDVSRPPLPQDYVPRLEELVSTGWRGDAVEYFMTAAVGMPAEYVTPMRGMPMWPALEALAHTLAYDGTVVAGFALPTSRVAAVSVPTLVLTGGQTPWISSGARVLVQAMPDAVHQILDGQPHNVDPNTVAPALAAFFTS
jgi:pimeloyl-ACP methyl ester carboxylesterase